MSDRGWSLWPWAKKEQKHWCVLLYTCLLDPVHYLYILNIYMCCQIIVFCNLYIVHAYAVFDTICNTFLSWWMSCLYNCCVVAWICQSTYSPAHLLRDCLVCKTYVTSGICMCAPIDTSSKQLACTLNAYIEFGMCR